MDAGQDMSHGNAQIGWPTMCCSWPKIFFLFTLLSFSSCTNPSDAYRSVDREAVKAFDIHITHRLPLGWKLGHEQHNSRALIREYLPAGQTVHHWREMITLQVFRHMALQPRASPKEFLARMATLTRSSCPESAIVRMLGHQQVGSVGGETAILGCRRMDRDHVSGARRGQGELAVYLIFHVENHLILFHRATRGPGFEAASAPINPSNALTLLRSMEPLRICRYDSPTGRRRGPRAKDGAGADWPYCR